VKIVRRFGDIIGEHAKFPREHREHHPMPVMRFSAPPSRIDQQAPGFSSHPFEVIQGHTPQSVADSRPFIVSGVRILRVDTVCGVHQTAFNIF
jgi:hypothetical protein